MAVIDSSDWVLGIELLARLLSNKDNQSSHEPNSTACFLASPDSSGDK
jgi:hypothetical protein